MVESVIAILISDDTIKSLVGLDEAQGTYKVYPVIAPQTEKYPYCVVRQTGGTRAGKGCSYEGSFSVASFHKSFDEVSAIDRAVINALDGFKSGNTSSLVHFINGVQLSQDDFVKEGSGDGLYAKVSNFTCQYELPGTT